MLLARVLSFTILLLLLSPARAPAMGIPDFTPNVVDPSGYLDESSRQAVNDELQKIRDSRHIWGAVFIVDTLDGEPIESVAADAFQKWRLGQKGVDNGLLLVLAMKDRKSRFEVGYGLEGVITDTVALHALDAYLAPKMRAGDTAGAIIDAFDFLSRIVAQDPDAVRELDQPQSGDSMNWRHGLIAWGVLLLAIWFCFPIRNHWVNRQRRRLMQQDPSLSLDREDIANAESKAANKAARPAAAPWKGNWMVQAFLSVNPGVFVVMLSASFVAAFYISLILPLLIALLIVHLSARRYGSPERYRRFLEGIAKKRAKMIRSGFIEEKEPGVYSYTPAYYASLRSSSSPSSGSSSGSSGSSSSSGGGSSGGGGASSGW